uniref:Uncharacterized protein n=1 Tax=Mustela putorius furo TaxID=9669 RepID=M3YQB5_MUSPF
MLTFEKINILSWLKQSNFSNWSQKDASKCCLLGKHGLETSSGQRSSPAGTLPNRKSARPASPRPREQEACLQRHQASVCRGRLRGAGDRTHPPATGSVMLCPDDDKMVLEMAENGNVLALPQLS